MGARALLALVVAAGAAKSVWSLVSNHVDKRGALVQGLSWCGLHFHVAPYNQGGRDKVWLPLPSIKSGSSHSSASGEQAA